MANKQKNNEVLENQQDQNSKTSNGKLNKQGKGKKKGLTDEQLQEIDLGQKLAWGSLTFICLAIFLAVGWKVYQSYRGSQPSLPQPTQQTDQPEQTKPKRDKPVLNPKAKATPKPKPDVEYYQVEPFIPYIGYTDTCKKIIKFKAPSGRLATICVFQPPNDWVLGGGLPEEEYTAEPGTALYKAFKIMEEKYGKPQ
ncbi:hypothetical protein ACE1B6_24425 [Aerosakkonemataceae cyanobacterium BLCC-F154]|uniref:Uncharacterized protein n=1 Tax=Floridaenema fluviatile BLCC-F154 TaxID=3153640 RepID=A0ABV4YHU4_9CYAN